MNAHSDEDLMDVYKNRSKYTPEAIEAMEAVLLERNLIENAAQIAAAQQEEEVFTKAELHADFELSEFGKVISDAEFAEECLKDSIYLERFVSPLHHYNWLNHFFIIFGIFGIILSVIFIAMGEFQPPFNIILGLSIVAALLLPLGIWKLSKNKAALTLVKKNNRNVLLITGPKDQHEMTLPLRYECYWDWHPVKLNLKQVKLSIFLYDDRNDACIELREFLELQKSPPPHWEMLPKKFATHKSFSFAYSNHGFQRPFLYKFQKIVDGLQEVKIG